MVSSSHVDMLFNMSLRRNPVAAASVLILLMKVFSGHTLTCQQAEYQIDNECCPMCPPGSRVKTHCYKFRSTSCLTCTEGTFMNQPTGRTQCFPCMNCDEDSGLKIKRSCTFISDTVCEPMEGFYCIDSTGDGCLAAQKHCEPGQYINQKGTASTDTVCSDCSEGTFSDGTFESCRPHTQCDSVNLQLIKAGTASTDAECGEHSSTPMTGIVIGVSVVFMLMIGTSAFLMYLKKKGPFKERTGNSENDSEKPLKRNTGSTTRDQVEDVGLKMPALRSEVGPASSALEGPS